MRIGPHETDLIGKWSPTGGKVVADETCERIELLISGYLKKVAGGAWETLYQDPADDRYWELTYPEGHMHGGGPPRLSNLSLKNAKGKYGDITK